MNREIGRPKQWQPFADDIPLEWHPDGRIRDPSGNILRDGAKQLRTLFGHAETRRILAVEWFGKPPRQCCVVCCDHSIGHHGGPPYRVVHLNGNRTDRSRDNLKYEPDETAQRTHELRCLELMERARPLNVPGRRSSKRVAGSETLSRQIDALPAMLFADDTGELNDRGNPFKSAAHATVPEQTRAMRFLSLPMDYTYYARYSRANQPSDDEWNI